MKRLLDVNEAAEYLGISAKTLYNWVSQRKVPFFKVGNMVRFDLQELDRFIKEHTIQPNDIWAGRT